MTVAGFEKFMIELCASPFTASAVSINDALEALDIEGDGNPDAVNMLKALELVANKSTSVAERLEELHKITSAKGNVVVEFRWR